MKKIISIKMLLLVAGLVLGGSASAQVVLNKYAAVKDLTVVASANTVITVDSANDFNIGDRIIIIQMKGASINHLDNSSFGKIINYNNAGNYEFATISGKSGNELKICSNLVKHYTVSDSSVQIVKVYVPKTNKYEVISNITAMPWNGRKGGIVAIETIGEIAFKGGNIDVTGKGFRGGRKSPNYILSGYNYAISNYAFFFSTDSLYKDTLQGGEKGEGIASYINRMSAGRGRQANGGGGGNSENCGGGGGSNGGAGGIGGAEVGSVSSAFGGLGGVKLDSLGKRLFLGGGGGGAHQNNDRGHDGAAGGGIIIIRANEITKAGGINSQIIANGGEAKSYYGAKGATSDGQGGGGAGGTIVLDVHTITTATSTVLNALAKGGHGGNNKYDYNQVYTAGGGGGGGGIVYYTGTRSSNLNPVTEGGHFGWAINSDNDSLAWGATSGANGMTESIHSFELGCLNHRVFGHVKTSGGKALAHSYVYLVHFNNSDSTLKVTDSTLTDSTGYYSFDNADSTVWVEATPDTSYHYELPTWYDSSVVFFGSKSINTHSGNNEINFSTIHGNTFSGSGQVSGKVYSCYLCKNGAPVNHLKIILYDDASKLPIAVTYTDINGAYSFSGLALKTYKVWVDKPRVNNQKTAPSILLSSSAPTAKDMNYVLYPNYLGITTAIQEVQTGLDQSVVIYPNPAHELINIELRGDVYNATAVLRSIEGRELQKVVLLNRTAQLETSTLAAGIYLLEVRTSGATTVRKVSVR